MKKAKHPGRKSLEETQGEPNKLIGVRVPVSVAKAMEAAGKKRPKKMSASAILAELACEKYGKKGK